ncbi:TcmI family type II polyketide cyclase [Nocardia sp. NPDC057227]|uniref:TcmI family type II polyketide cyclase n=1 Tax=Nocardia sp. NPDC057227 TaxID=3346056 RepID=UPI003626DDE1
MHSTLIVARMNPDAATDVAELFRAFDESDMPHLMGTRRRQLFAFHGLYFHLQDFDSDDGHDRIQSVRADPRFVRISTDLNPYVHAYDPETWRSPADAMAGRFYTWSAR